MLKIEHLSLRRGDWQRHYDLQVATGTILTLQGRSGAGKSALLWAIAGLEQAVSGDIRWQNTSLLPLPIEQRPVSMLFQEHNLFEHLSVRNNLKLGLNFGSGQAWFAAVQAGAAALEIEDKLDSQPADLSGGQRQRVAILRTLLRPEPLILLDEPFAELDAVTRSLALAWVKQTARQHHKTLLVVTHQNEDVEQLADHNIILS